MLFEAHGISKFVVVCGYTDLRKGVDGLSQLVEGTYNTSPFEEGTLFLFCGRRGDRIKALLWEGNGFLMLYKRYEKRWRTGSSSSMIILNRYGKG